MATPNDALGVATDNGGLTAAWNWKQNYVDGLASGDGLERFSQGSATPDTTILFAGPARFTGIGSDTTKLHPIGMVDNFSFMSSAQLQRLFEIGSNRSFFTRGKTISQMQLSGMLCDQMNLMTALTQESYNHNSLVAGKYGLEARGMAAPGVKDQAVSFNLDSEVFGVPFGILMLFKTKGSEGQSGLRGKILGASYLEYCMMSGWQFNVASQSPVIAENLQIEFDRVVPVDLK